MELVDNWITAPVFNPLHNCLTGGSGPMAPVRIGQRLYLPSEDFLPLSSVGTFLSAITSSTMPNFLASSAVMK